MEILPLIWNKDIYVLIYKIEVCIPHLAQNCSVELLK